MRANEPSRTARGVALARLRLDRPAWPSGDAGADTRLATTLAEGLDREMRERAERRAQAGEFLSYFGVRTRFFDAAVVRALEHGVRQIVILGAGYDGRALRYRTPGVRFFEVDHPATQADKRKRLRAIDASLDGIVFVTADFTEHRLGEELDAAGHDASQPSLFMCEGVLRYLPEDAFRELLGVAAARATPDSELAASISTREGDAPEHEREREQALAASGEPVLTVPTRDVALAWVAGTGWAVISINDVNEEAVATRPGRLLVRARRA